ncbi:SDR family oxidoreductase [Pseudomonas sp. YuFO20]|jgi:NAD(P)-dependent dehydrogenase (short-subunit alcohol dehydrogenase family)|uniref:SDR family oxidoreductase n=1 Tax=Pseudomonas neuropathica TaxID=2730425 RepID=A0ACC7N346_9PSED|nr:SDR family oxidoreductase [Pseudomonas sp. YuFO20]MEB2518512.1 SDR family oxidoreductase [Pseudomonas sp. YuFO20]
MQRLQGKVAVITGGNSGIGLAAACLFAKEGAQVIITARRQEILNEAIRQIGHGAIGIKGDVASLEHHGEVAEQVRARFGALDVYMANAGVITLTPSQQVTPQEYDAQFNINTRGVFFGVQAITPLLRDGGSIILTSSLAASKVLDGHAVYAGSKAAIAAFARNWALELRARRIRVNVLSPGPVDTAIIGKLGVTEEHRPGFVQMMADMIPAGRLGEAHELAQAALYLASSDSAFVNGIELHVDGGMSLV